MEFRRQNRTVKQTGNTAKVFLPKAQGTDTRISTT
ncbi:MAG: DUF2080 family transposase-associated protein [Ruminococcus sp.]|nr:DUF2080 family transposase-associated protein [Ruminococcus sp.]